MILYGLRAARGTGSATQQTTQVGSIAQDIEGLGFLFLETKPGMFYIYLLFMSLVSCL